jgi:hypothetical protein
LPSKSKRTALARKPQDFTLAKNKRKAPKR